MDVVLLVRRPARRLKCLLMQGIDPEAVPFGKSHLDFSLHVAFLRAVGQICKHEISAL
jgi:hypothetical protein